MPADVEDSKLDPLNEIVNALAVDEKTRFELPRITAEANETVELATLPVWRKAQRAAITVLCEITMEDEVSCPAEKVFPAAAERTVELSIEIESPECIDVDDNNKASVNCDMNVLAVEVMVSKVVLDPHVKQLPAALQLLEVRYTPLLLTAPEKEKQLPPLITDPPDRENVVVEVAPATDTIGDVDCPISDDAPSIVKVEPTTEVPNFATEAACPLKDTTDEELSCISSEVAAPRK